MNRPESLEIPLKLFITQSPIPKLRIASKAWLYRTIIFDKSHFAPLCSTKRDDTIKIDAIESNLPCRSRVTFRLKFYLCRIDDSYNVHVTQSSRWDRELARSSRFGSIAIIGKEYVACIVPPRSINTRRSADTFVVQSGEDSFKKTSTAPIIHLYMQCLIVTWNSTLPREFTSFSLACISIKTTIHFSAYYVFHIFLYLSRTLESFEVEVCLQLQGIVPAIRRPDKFRPISELKGIVPKGLNRAAIGVCRYL